MSKHRNRAQWALFVGLTFGLVASALTHAGQPKPKLDLEAEAKQSAEEDKKEAEDRAKGIKPQRIFIGTFTGIPDDPSQQVSPDVVGTFATDRSDQRPGRTYLVKLESRSQSVHDMLKRTGGKKAQLTGKLRNFDENGEAKYLIVSTVMELAPTPRVVKRRSVGGL
jgi:hypothetical protein